MDTPNIKETFAVDWKYISEGGATIVFSYAGIPHPHFAGMVLRLRKKGISEPPSESKVDELDDPQIAFQNEIMNRLLPVEHLPKLLTVGVTRDWLQALSQLHNKERPQKRREVDEIDLARTKAVLATDLLGGSGALGIEIKPKWAFLPNPNYLSPSSKEMKQQTCRFCMHTHMRQSLAAVTYCPLDLFSGSVERVTFAVESLWNTWESTNGTANNFKIFVEGNMVNPADKHMLAPTTTPTPETHLIKESLISALVQPLLQTPVLHLLNKLQRTLDVLDIEGLRHLWNLAGKTENMGHGEPQPEIEEWKYFVDTYLKKSEHRPSKLDPAELRYFMMAYMLSATFKDCSIIIRRSAPLDIVKGGDNSKVNTTVTVIDLDTKAIDRLARWEKLDQEIMAAYVQVKDTDRKNCVDGWAS